MNLPGMYQLYTGQVSVSKMKTVKIEDLLGRDPIRPDMTEVFEYIRGKAVLITGVGSIGSELARQIASHQPKHLILFDIYENNAYDIQLELRKKYPELKLDTIIGSVRDSRKIFQAFAAKVKEGKADEVPQLFTHGMKDMITVPEITEALKVTQTEFVAVRFGNVLGSNGSVIPLFKRQIEAGGPVTVTHPDIIRYFMTIPEAVSLVLLAGTYAKGGEIFVLDMGEPVKIDTLARNLIRLSGYTPDVDIRLTYTGLRPGEKLYEEKLMAEEGLKKTKNDLIHIGCPIPFDIEEFLKQLDSLLEASYKNKDDMKERVQKVVSTYHPA